MLILLYRYIYLYVINDYEIYKDTQGLFPVCNENYKNKMIPIYEVLVIDELLIIILLSK